MVEAERVCDLVGDGAQTGAAAADTRDLHGWRQIFGDIAHIRPASLLGDKANSRLVDPLRYVLKLDAGVVPPEVDASFDSVSVDIVGDLVEEVPVFPEQVRGHGTAVLLR